MAERKVEQAAAKFLLQMHEALSAFIAKHPAVEQANAPKTAQPVTSKNKSKKRNA
jgi:hypothetical protein